MKRNEKKISKGSENCKIWAVMLSVFLLSSILGSQVKAGWVDESGRIYYLGGTVGIGTNNPGASLHVAAENNGNDGTIKIGARAWLQHRDAGSTITSLINDYNSNGAKIDFRIKGTASENAVMTILGNGYVGIGTNNPGAGLHVAAENNGNDGTIKIGARAWLQHRDAGNTIISLINDYNSDGSKIDFRMKGTATGNAVMTILGSGNVGIGTTNPGDARLAVRGKIKATEVVVLADNPTNWPDHVFKADYNLMKLDELENNIKENGHLPEIPSASEVAKDGVNVGDMQAKLLQKVEELTLYVIEQNKEINILKKELAAVKQEK